MGLAGATVCSHKCFQYLLSSQSTLQLFSPHCSPLKHKWFPSKFWSQLDLNQNLNHVKKPEPPLEPYNSTRNCYSLTAACAHLFIPPPLLTLPVKKSQWSWPTWTDLASSAFSFKSTSLWELLNKELQGIWVNAAHHLTVFLRHLHVLSVYTYSIRL